MNCAPYILRLGMGLAVLLATGRAYADERAPAERPNVLLIAIDDLNDWVGCMGGHPQAQTPHIDRLAAQGTLMANAHCQAPLCNPSRASVLTGLRPSTTGIYALQPGIRKVEHLRDRVTLPQHFARHGYFTFTCGKVFHDGSLSADEQKAEFEVWGDRGPMPYPPQKFVETPDPIKAMDWGVFPDDDRQQGDWRIADSAIQQLENLPSDRPFFMAVGFRLPHVPCFASQLWFDRFPEESLELPAVRFDDRSDVPEFAWKLHWKLPEPRLSWLLEAQQWKPLVRAYLASTLFMDSQIGRVLDALERTGHASNTIIVLWSDHGWHLGEKGITGKNTLWERSTRVPLIFAGPGITAGGRSAEPAELLDIYPTLVELCGLEPRDDLEGHSLVPQLQNPNAPRLWPAITTHNPGNHAVRSRRYRYIRYADGSEELYDLAGDPHEWNNLAGNPQFSAIQAELAQWIPERDADPAPGSVSRLLVQQNGEWYWEGKKIAPDELEK